jgi:hypothetical protein
VQVDKPGARPWRNSSGSLCESLDGLALTAYVDAMGEGLQAEGWRCNWVVFAWGGAASGLLMLRAAGTRTAFTLSWRVFGWQVA